jgi:hypothetical protein
MIFCFVRETKQLTLEELDRKLEHAIIYGSILIFIAEVFSVPTKKFIHYELTVWLPWFIKRYIFRQNIPRPPPIIATAEEALVEKRL